MRTATLRTPGLIAVLVALVATLTACGSGPGQVNSAVIIGDRTISVDEVQALVEKVVREQPQARPLARERKLDLVAREAVRQLVIHELIDDVAEDEDLTVDSDDVAEALANSQVDQEIPSDGSMPPEVLVQQLVSRVRDANEFGTDQALLAKLAEKYHGRASVTYNLITLTDLDDAKALAERIHDSPEDSADLMTEAGAGTTEPRIEQPSGPTLGAVYLTAPVGTVFVLPAGQGEQGGGYQVVHLLDREVSEELDPGYDPSEVPVEQMPTLGVFGLREAALDADLRISPRYGVWNDAELEVVPKLEADVSGMVLVPSGDTQP